MSATWIRFVRWVRKPENALFTGLVLWHLIPVWGFAYFPSQDGGEHIANANILRCYFTPSGALFREYFVINRNLDPNWLGHIILAALMSVLPSNLAEKALLSSYVILFPVSVRYALRAIRSDAGWLAVFAFPFALNYLVHMGFWNYALSLPLFFFVVGYWTYHRSGFGPRESVALTGLSLALYFAHPVSYVLASAYIAFAGAFLTVAHAAMLAGTRQFTLRGLWAGVRNRVAMPFYALLPSMALLLAFVGRRPNDRGAPGPDLWRRLRTLDSLVAYQESEVRLTTLVVWLFVAMGAGLLLVKTVKRRATVWDAILGMVGGVIVIYFHAPEVMAGGGSFVSHRLNLMPFLIAILWFGAQTYHRWTRRTAMAVAAALSVTLTAHRFPKYAELNDYLAELMSAETHIARDSTFLPLIYSYQGLDPNGYFLSTRTGPFIHATGRIAERRNAVELENYEANTGYFPTIWRYERNPYVHISVAPGSVSSLPPSVDFLSYRSKTGGKVDYVLLWNYRPDENEWVKSVFRQLATGYDLIYTSPKRGYCAVYRRKDLADASRQDNG